MAELREGEARRGAVHETGHMLAALSLGVAIKQIVKIEGDRMPVALTNEGCDLSTATEFSGFQNIEPRRQLLVAMAGIAAEELVFGIYNQRTAAQDFDSIAPNVLSVAGTSQILAKKRY